MNRRNTWLRDRDVVSLIDAFVVSAITSLLLVRLYLFLAGYPQVGGGGLHIAHMVWGGLLMLAAIIIAVSFVTITARWLTAVLGGIGFGLFVDEIGKFVTSDNNYFFKPAAALIYVIFIILFLASRTITRRSGFSTEERLVNAIEILKEAAVNDLDELEKEKALILLRGTADSAIARTVRSLFETMPPAARLPWPSRLHVALRKRYEPLARSGWFPRALAAAVLVGAIGSLVEILVILALHGGAWSSGGTQFLDVAVASLGSLHFVAWLELAAGVASLSLAVAGVILGPGSPHGLHMFERTIFVWVLIIQPFAFYEAQFFAAAGLVISLPLLAVVQFAARAESHRLARNNEGR